jgi:hypothetical protein
MELDKLFLMVNKASIAKVYLTKSVVLILRMPSYIKRNEIGFHCSEDIPAIGYPNSDLYYLNGRRMPKWVFRKFFDGKLTLEDFVNEENEDIKAGIITLIKENKGNKGLLKFLGAELVDTKIINHNSGRVETVKLYKTKQSYPILVDSKGNMNVPYAWTEMQCGSTGTSYLIDTCPSFTDAVESMKFHRPILVPTGLDYNFTQFNN